MSEPQVFAEGYLVSAWKRMKRARRQGSLRRVWAPKPRLRSLALAWSRSRATTWPSINRVAGAAEDGGGVVVIDGHWYARSGYTRSGPSMRRK